MQPARFSQYLLTCKAISELIWLYWLTLVNRKERLDSSPLTASQEITVCNNQYTIRSSVHTPISTHFSRWYKRNCRKWNTGYQQPVVIYVWCGTKHIKLHDIKTKEKKKKSHLHNILLLTVTCFKNIHSVGIFLSKKEQLTQATLQPKTSSFLPCWL